MTGLSGEGRFRWLHVRAGATERVAAVARELYGGIAWVRTVEEIDGDGWFGGPLSDAFRRRLGDVALVARPPVSFADPADPGRAAARGAPRLAHLGRGARAAARRAAVRIYTRRGDDGTTSLRGGGRVAKSDAVVEVLGALDEAQAALGVARAASARAAPSTSSWSAVERDLWAVMAEVAAARSNGRRGAAQDGDAGDGRRARSRRSTPTRRGLGRIDGFAVPGENRLAAALDFARTVVRRAERRLVALEARQRATCSPT